MWLARYHARSSGAAPRKKTSLRFPREVQRDMGYALFLAQMGERHRKTKILKGFGSAGVVEVRESFEGTKHPSSRWR